MSAKTADEVRELATKHLDIVLAAGFTKPSSSLTWEDRVLLVQSVTLHYVLLESKAEIDQFMDGLKTFHLLDIIKLHPLLLKPSFCQRTSNLTPGTKCILYFW